MADVAEAHTGQEVSAEYVDWEVAPLEYFESSQEPMAGNFYWDSVFWEGPSCCRNKLASSFPNPLVALLE